MFYNSTGGTMTETNEKQTGFLGTYFDRSAVLRISRLSDIFAWIVLAYHLGQVVISLGVYVLQIARGLLFIGGFTDVIQQVWWYLQPIVPGLWYFVGIQAVSKLLPIFMDIEDNTRRAARK
jgi:hypothetical protein